jgi:tetratricopeptide (TPR) repeat protein
MSSRATTTLSYLRRHYFDDEKLKTYAIAEFVRSVRSGRLIAFTGSFTTKAYGYQEWRSLLQLALREARKTLRQAALDPANRKKHLQLIASLSKVARRDREFDGRVAFSAVAQMLDHISTSDLSRPGNLTKEAIQAIAEHFKVSEPLGGFNSRETSIRALFEDLGIDRVVTTNYDLELEMHAIGDEPRVVGKKRHLGPKVEKLIKECADSRQSAENEDFSLDVTLPNAERVVSDIMLRDRPEALIEFAIGCPEIDQHIFHLHGRADVPDKMVLSYRDYDYLYRRSGLGKAPFEHALRILFAGNPVLFVGLGMTEPEVNATLAEFVGNHPYARKAPAILIWNAPKAWRRLGPRENDKSFYSEGDTYPRITPVERKAAFRLDMLHRLGVLTIFSDDFDKDNPPLLPLAWRGPDPGESEKLRRSLITLSLRAAREHERRFDKIRLLTWRNSVSRISRGLNNADHVINTWIVDWPKAAGTAPSPSLAEPQLDDAHFLTVLIRPDGAGKTSRSMEIATNWINRHPTGRVLIINFNMRLDTDSILALLAVLFRYKPSMSVEDALQQTSSREAQFRDDSCGLQSKEPLLIILKGLERIFDVNGHPLSAEFDQFLRVMIARRDELAGKIWFAVLGTERISTYFDAAWTKQHIEQKSAKSAKQAKKSGGSIFLHRFLPREAASLHSPYLGWLKQRFASKPLDKARQSNKALVEYATQRRHIFRTILTAEALRSASVRDPELALGIIRVMSFIGQPVEISVLFHAPRLRDTLELNVPGAENIARARINRALADLKRIGLIGEVNRRDRPQRKKPHERRYSVHLSLQTEIRDRNSIPLSDSILSSAYNMSLFSAQPADCALPEAELHDELGQLVDWLIGAYKDIPYDRSAQANDRAAPHVSATLRAGFALIRGLYSTSALLSVDRGDRLVSDERDGLLTEHAQRLERLLDAFDAIWRAREACPSPIGPGPLYPDELVWLHNERGVVKLAQGDLYEARFSFDEADRINREHVEFHDESHNWRRITLNQIVVDIERGKLQSAEDRMNAIERKIGAGKADHIRNEYLDERRSTRRIRIDTKVSHEEILAMALITGYRGLAGHLRGELDAARAYFDRAIRVLQRMDEQRALALFRRHKASLHSDLGEVSDLHRECRIAIAGAESVRQLDIVYAGRLVRACYPNPEAKPGDNAPALRAALDTLEYATLADMHRLLIEAQARLARAKADTGDYNAALEHVSEALAVAARYGMTLYKISMRTLMGDILIKRGNVESGKALIRSAINGAVRVGYQRAIEGARRTNANA